MRYYVFALALAAAGCHETEPASSTTITLPNVAKPDPPPVAVKPAQENGPPKPAEKPIATLRKYNPPKPSAAELQKQRYAAYVKANGEPKEFHGELKVGMFGRFDPRGSSVFRVDGNSGLLVRYYVSDVTLERGSQGVPVARSQSIERHLYVTGADMAGAIDDAPFKIAGVYEITGTHTYKTAIGGRRTILKAERIDPSIVR